MRNVLAEAVRCHFRYVMDVWCFAITDEQIYPDHFGNALVQLCSETVGLLFTLDRGVVDVQIGPSSSPASSWQDLLTTLSYIVPGLSHLNYCLPQERLPDDEAIHWQVARLAQLLQQHGTQILDGKFALWDDVRESSRMKVEEDYRMVTGKRFPRPVRPNTPHTKDTR